jgi:hypothetical protein
VPGWCPGYWSKWIDQELRLQLDRVGSTPALAAEQVQLQLDRAKPALSEPEAALQLDRLQLERL